MTRARAPFYLIRHGETDWNRERRFQGQTDIAMNATGHAQASANGALLASLQSDWDGWRFVSSPLGRTRQTMELLRQSMGLPADDYSLEPRIIELTFGDWEGHTLSELERSIPDEVAKRQDFKWTYRQPNGESYEDGLTRVSAFFDELDSPAVIVTHGGIVRIVRKLFENLDGNEAAAQDAHQDVVYYFDGTAGRYIGPGE